MVAVSLAAAKLLVSESRGQVERAKRLIERDDRNVRKTRRKGARRNWYRIQPWQSILNRAKLEEGCNCNLTGGGHAEGGAASCTMHFGVMVQGNIYSVSLSLGLAGAKVYTVKH